MTPPRILAARLRAYGPALVPAGLALAIVIAWAASGGGYESLPGLGGYDPDPWYLGALALLGLLAATLAGLGLPRISRPAGIALGALTAYTLWSFASIAWAGDPGTALRGSDRTLVYLAAFTLFAMLPWTPAALRAALGLLVAGFGVLAIVTAIRVAHDGDPSSLYIGDRLSYPLGYYNADAAMFTIAALAAIALAARRSTPAVVRAVAVALAGLCLQLALLGQSRGWLFTVPVVLVVALVVIPNRLRLLAAALGPALATVAAAPALLDVYSKANALGYPVAPARLEMVLHQRGQHALLVAVIADLVLLLVAAAVVVLDRRVTLSEHATRAINRAGAALAVLAVLAGAGAGLVATHGHVVRKVEHAWNSFASTRVSAGAATNGSTNSSSRFGSLGSQRADFWRVALREAGRHPLIGIGQDNFADSYLAERRTNQEPRWAHSIELRLLVHTGIVGLLMFVAFLVAALVAALRGAGRDPARRVAAGLALVPLIVWLVHGSLDWFWEFPALSVPALGFLGAATALGRPKSPAARLGPARRRAVSILAVAITALAIAAIGVPYLAARDVQRSIDVWPRNPVLAFRELRSAADLVSFDARTYLVGGAIALNLGDGVDARPWLTGAARHDPRAWLPPLLLGVIAGEHGDRAGARAELLRARPLDPAEPLISDALARVGSGHPLTFAEVQASLAQRSTARFGR
jgi:O-Antigen ligase